jgi:2-polyprenyl-3-methyl-5-hydroxy-6-metoxy-1,4-benzoquinol methylase
MRQTPAHELHNPDLLKLIPKHSSNIIEIGCSSGALAREFKKINPGCTYYGVDIDPTYIGLASRYCDGVQIVNLDEVDDKFYSDQSIRDTWIFGDTLEHLKDPWKVLGSIRKVIPSSASVIACIPNAQHWSMQVKLSIGDFRYQESGLLDKTHLRWFTRQTIVELFDGAGFKIVEGSPRIFEEKNRDRFLALIGELARAAGVDSNLAMNDAMPLQYVVRGMPK